jgi:hypothetical protein
MQLPARGAGGLWPRAFGPRVATVPIQAVGVVSIQHAIRMPSRGAPWPSSASPAIEMENGAFQPSDTEARLVDLLDLLWQFVTQVKSQHSPQPGRIITRQVVLNKPIGLLSNGGVCCIVSMASSHALTVPKSETGRRVLQTLRPVLACPEAAAGARGRTNIRPYRPRSIPAAKPAASPTRNARWSSRVTVAARAIASSTSTPREIR